MNIGDESQVCPTCEELEWQCQCPPAPDEVINPPYSDDDQAAWDGLKRDDAIRMMDDADEESYDDEPEGLGFEDSMCLKYPLKDYDAGYDHYDQGW